jgi:hypothetical protein
MGELTHRPDCFPTCPLVTAQQYRVPAVTKRFALTQSIHQNLDILKAKIQSLSRERMDYVRGITDQRDARSDLSIGRKQGEWKP